MSVFVYVWAFPTAPFVWHAVLVFSFNDSKFNIVAYAIEYINTRESIAKAIVTTRARKSNETRKWCVQTSINPGRIFYFFFSLFYSYGYDGNAIRWNDDVFVIIDFCSYYCVCGWEHFKKWFFNFRLMLLFMKIKTTFPITSALLKYIHRNILCYRICEYVSLMVIYFSSLFI